MEESKMERDGGFPPDVAAFLSTHATDEEVCALRAALHHDPEALRFALLEWAATMQQQSACDAPTTRTNVLQTNKKETASLSTPFALVESATNVKSLYHYSSAMYNEMQKLVIPVALGGASLMCASGSRSGRATCVAMVAERLLDPTATVAKRCQLFILCSVQKHARVSRLLREFILLNTALVIAVDSAEASQGILHPNLYAMQDAAATPMVVLLADANERGALHVDVLSSIPKLFDRLRHSGPPQFVGLLNEPLSSNSLAELEHLLAGGSGVERRNLQAVSSPHFFFRRLLQLSQGTGHFLSQQTEEGKVAGLERVLMSHMFDEPVIIVVVATRRKAELLAECCKRRVPASIAVTGRNVDSVQKGRELLADLRSQLPNPVVRRACVVCDQSGITALFDGLETRDRSPAVVFYDVPVPVLLLSEMERKGCCDEAAVIVFALPDSSEVKNVERASPGIRWIAVDL